MGDNSLWFDAKNDLFNEEFIFSFIEDRMFQSSVNVLLSFTSIKTKYTKQRSSGIEHLLRTKRGTESVANICSVLCCVTESIFKPCQCFSSFLFLLVFLLSVSRLFGTPSAQLCINIQHHFHSGFVQIDNQLKMPQQATHSLPVTPVL